LSKRANSPKRCSILGAVDRSIRIYQAVTEKPPNVILLSDALSIIGWAKNLPYQTCAIVGPDGGVNEERLDEHCPLVELSPNFGDGRGQAAAA
jgi:hypothetical protein